MYQLIFEHTNKKHFGANILIYQGEHDYLLVAKERDIGVFLIDLRISKCYPIDSLIEQEHIDFSAAPIPEHIEAFFDVSQRGCSTVSSWMKEMMNAALGKTGMTRKEFLLFLKSYPHLRKYFSPNQYFVSRKDGKYIVSYCDIRGPRTVWEANSEADAYAYLHQEFTEFYMYADNADCFNTLSKLILHHVPNVCRESLHYENVNYQAINIYFAVAEKQYRLSVELDSGIHMHLSIQDGYTRTGEAQFIKHPIMNKATHKQIRRIKRRTIFFMENRATEIAKLICEKLAHEENDL